MKYVAIAGIIIAVAGIIVALGVSDDSVTKIGISTWGTSFEYDQNIQGFQDAIKSELEEDEIKFIIKNPNADKLAQLAIMNNFDDQNVDLVYTLTTPGTKIAQEIFKDKPIIFSVVTFPVEANIVDSMESSKNNIVGTSNYIDIEEQIKEIVKHSDVKNLAFVHRAHELNSLIQLSLFEKYAERYQINIINISASDLEEIEKSVNYVIDNLDGIYLACDTLIQTGGHEVVINIATEHKKPVFSCVKEGMHLGAVFGLISDSYSLGYESGLKAVRVLNGEEPSDIPSSFPLTHKVMVNKDAAEFLGMEFVDDHSHWIYGGVLER